MNQIFSEIPLFTFEQFLRDQFLITTPSKNYPIFKGKNAGSIITSRLNSFNVYVKKDEGYKKLTCTVLDKQWNQKTLEDIDDTYISIISGDFYSYNASSTFDGVYHKIELNHNIGFTPSVIQIFENSFEITAQRIDNGPYITILYFESPVNVEIKLRYVNTYDKIYLKRGDEFYKWLQIAVNKKHKDFLNINKTWLYLGEIIFDNFNYDGNFVIRHKGLKNFVTDATPEINRTYLITMFLRYYFDRVYQKGYFNVDNLKSLIDVDEISIDHIHYMANESKLNIENYKLDENTTRELVKSHINLLKKKGTYQALEDLYKILIPKTTNELTIYDRWHPKNVIDNNLDPYDHFIDFPWKKFYDDLDAYLQDSSNLEYIFNDGLNWTITSFIESDLNTSNTEIQKMEDESAYWLIYTKNEYNSLPSIQFVDKSFMKILPAQVSRVDKKFFKAQFNSNKSGYVFITSNDTSSTWTTIKSGTDELFVNKSGLVSHAWHSELNKDSIYTPECGMALDQFLFLLACIKCFKATNDSYWYTKAIEIGNSLKKLYKINELPAVYSDSIFAPNRFFAVKNDFISEGLVLNFTTNFTSAENGTCQAYIPSTKEAKGNFVNNIICVFDSNSHLESNDPFSKIINGEKKEILKVTTTKNGTVVTCNGPAFSGIIVYTHTLGEKINIDEQFDVYPYIRKQESNEITYSTDSLMVAYDTFNEMYSITTDSQWNILKSMTLNTILKTHNVTESNREMLSYNWDAESPYENGNFMETDPLYDRITPDDLFLNASKSITIAIPSGVGEVKFGRNTQESIKMNDESILIDIATSIPVNINILMEMNGNEYENVLWVNDSTLKSYTIPLSGFIYNGNSLSNEILNNNDYFITKFMISYSATDELNIEIGKAQILPLSLADGIYVPGAPPYICNIRNNEIVDWKGYPGIGFCYPDVWSKINQVSPNNDIINNLVKFIEDSQEFYYTNYSILGPFMNAFVWERKDTWDLDLGWTNKWSEKNYTWGGYQYRLFTSLAKAGLDLGVGDSYDLKNRIRLIMSNFLEWINTNWVESTTWFNGPPTTFTFVNNTPLIKTDYHSAHFAALIAKGCLYNILGSYNKDLSKIVLKKCMQYLESRYQTDGKMKGTWCRFNEGAPIWYTQEHSEILITLSQILELAPNLLYEIGFSNSVVYTWIEESKEWINSYIIEN